MVSVRAEPVEVWMNCLKPYALRIRWHRLHKLCSCSDTSHCQQRGHLCPIAPSTKINNPGIMDSSSPFLFCAMVTWDTILNSFKKLTASWPDRSRSAINDSSSACFSLSKSNWTNTCASSECLIIPAARFSSIAFKIAERICLSRSQR